MNKCAWSVRFLVYLHFQNLLLTFKDVELVIPTIVCCSSDIFRRLWENIPCVFVHFFYPYSVCIELVDSSFSKSIQSVVWT